MPPASRLPSRRPRPACDQRQSPWTERLEFRRVATLPAVRGAYRPSCVSVRLCAFVSNSVNSVPSVGVRQPSTTRTWRTAPSSTIAMSRPGLLDAIDLEPHDASIHALRILDHDAVLGATGLEDHLVARPRLRDARVDVQARRCGASSRGSIRARRGTSTPPSRCTTSIRLVRCAAAASRRRPRRRTVRRDSDGSRRRCACGSAG